MLGRPEDRHSEKLRSPVPGEIPSASVGQRTVTDITPTTAGPFPVPRHLLEKLRTYPRLRDVVVAYLLVQERIAKYEEIMVDLNKVGKSADKDFWDRLHKKLGGEGLRADFPNSLLGDAQFENCVRAFDTEHRKARDAAEARSNPFQSAESADEVAYAAVRAILKAAENLAIRCKAEARSLLDELQEAVNKIFADEEPPTPIAATERSTGSSPATASDALVPTLRDTGEKQLRGGFPAPDVETQPTAERGAT